METKKDLFKQIIFILLGNCILAAAVSFLILPNNILTGGVAGVAVALEPLIHIKPVYVIDFLTIGLFIVGAIFLGKRFAMRTIVSTIIYPMLVTTFSWIATAFFPEGTFLMEPLLASLYSGLFMGIGVGLVFKVDASTGGMDIPALIMHKYIRIKEGDAVMIIDTLTVLLGLYTYGLQPALIGIVSVVVSGVAINRMIMLGTQAAMNVMIISEKWDTIRSALMDHVGRGVTLLDAKGGYHDKKRPVVMCVITQHQYPQLEQIVNAIDPQAFFIVNNVHSVHGEGFSQGERL
ncbi:YitT family protein [Dubosiella newyorkensis]|jgi:uncharacterized membrane-anchored protein YitT (DUF2179 family)|uniref:Membrane protein n=2 Tax=Dubosiella newyorkensis TaxID=1862672 RepID=A0A1U7NPU5_9FIRM|nr:YitT family protein [Dubosiella newyorkensis]MCI9040701.1 YitT family protein [Dubosiella newyorkensis]OLU47657.1 membrane protein [Dubosiella newyorkensis]